MSPTKLNILFSPVLPEHSRRYDVNELDTLFERDGSYQRLSAVPSRRDNSPGVGRVIGVLDAHWQANFHGGPHRYLICRRRRQARAL